MTKKYGSLFEELNNFVPEKSKSELIENRANHAITAMINILEEISSNYTEEEAIFLEKRLISSVKGKDPKRFQRGIYKVNKKEQ